jgi:hypothetical protein
LNGKKRKVQKLMEKSEKGEEKKGFRRFAFEPFPFGFACANTPVECAHICLNFPPFPKSFPSPFPRDQPFFFFSSNQFSFCFSAILGSNAISDFGG